MKKIVAIFMVVSMMLALTACGGATSTQPAAQTETQAATEAAAKAEAAVEEKAEAAVAEEPIVIGVDYSTSDKYCIQVLDGIKQEAEKYGYTVVSAEGQHDPEKTLANIDSFLLKGAKYVFVVSPDITLLDPIQTKCEEKGAKVGFTAGASADGFTIITAEGGSHYDVATVMSNILADAALERWNGEVDLPVVTYSSTMGQDGQDIVDACSKVFKEKLGIEPEDIYLVDCPMDNMKASELYTGMFTANPNAEHILAYGFVDIHHGVPLYNAAKSAGKLENMIMVSTNQADDSTPVCMKESPDTWIAQMPKSGFAPGKAFVDLIVDEVENGVEIEKKIYNPQGEATIATAEDIDQFFTK